MLFVGRVTGFLQKGYQTEHEAWLELLTVIHKYIAKKNDKRKYTAAAEKKRLAIEKELSVKVFY